MRTIGIIAALLVATEARIRAAEPGLLDHWILDASHIDGATVANLAGGEPAAIAGKVTLHAGGAGLLLDGETNALRVTRDIGSVTLPREGVTAEAWVAVYEPRRWGGIAGALQDNGGFEKGWLLGYCEDRFSFALSSAGADDGDGRMTYLTAGEPFEPGTVHHVAGTYDGTQMRIYVDGVLRGATREQRGAILYPPKAVYALGIYEDDDESFPLQGELYEVRVLDGALSPDEIRARAERRPARIPAPLRFAIPPHVRHIGAGDVLIAWQAEEAAASAIEYGETPALGKRIDDPAETAAHRIRVAGLRPESEYHARIIAVEKDGAVRATPLFSFDAGSDLAPDAAIERPSLHPDEARAAARILDRSGIADGYCIDLGCGDGRLAYEIARRTRLQVIGIEEDEAAVARAREALERAGLYGSRVTLRAGSLATLPYVSRIANLVVSARAAAGGVCPTPKAEILRLLRPSGGVACILGPEGEEILFERTGPPAGAGEWTHLYADAANTAASADQVCPPLRIQWFGRPGPRNMIDRHHRALGPLAAGGRLFAVGNNRILGVDAYNGTLLWDVGIPGSRRVAAARDGGHVVAAPEAVYVPAGNACFVLAEATGEVGRCFHVPAAAAPAAPRDWGITAVAGDLLVGSAQKPGASRTGHSRSAILGGTYYDDQPIATSDALFAMDRGADPERVRWIYRREGGSAIINSAIAIGGGCLHLVESRTPEALADPDGRVKLDALVGEGRAMLVSLDLASGEIRWEREIALAPLRHVLFLSYARGTLVVTGTRNEGGHPRYDLAAFDAEDGKPLWSNHYGLGDAPVNGDHGEQDQHPAIVGDIVYSRPYAFDLRTGERKDFVLDRGGHGCGTLTASAHALYGRGGNPWMYPLAGGGRERIRLTQVSRPGCWINILPAGGLILIPEGSSGCTCGFPIQASIALIGAESGR
ncbi:MAG: methyltransferase domain-containing protein [Planctomycetes bacterium]|nr:methyltransferase domain-containing protein [Planctomycetota bacterium]